VSVTGSKKSATKTSNENLMLKPALAKFTSEFNVYVGDASLSVVQMFL
jgi:hypothetical protein